MYKKFYLKLMLISGAVLLAFSLYVLDKQINPEWKTHQKEYKAQFMDAAQDDEMIEKAHNVKIGHNQIYLSSLKKVDRCMYCHMGVDNPLMAKADVPYKTHTGDYLDNHPIAKFGCTVCHEGQGRATNKRDAHAIELSTHWDTPILPIKYIESSCAKCHDAEMLKKNGAEKLAKGEQLFKTKGCKGCHKLNGVGGVLGKALDGIGSQPKHYFPLRYVEGDKTTYAWLLEHFIDPRKIVPESEMKVTLTGEEADLLTIYALTIRADEAPKTYRRITKYREAPMSGEALYKMYCVACHTTGTISFYDEIFSRSIPAIMNPTFTKTIDDKFLKKIVEEGRNGTQMTAWKSDAAGLTNEEINKIVAYLVKDRPAERPEPFGFASMKTDMARGAALYKERCVMCHAKDGKGGANVLGISLKNPVTQGADPEFLAITVRDGRPGTPMVPFGETGLKLGKQDIADIVAYVKNFPDNKQAGSEEGK